MDSEVGHCKDVHHVRVETLPPRAGFGPGYASAVFTASTHCVNLPSYTGWVVTVILDANGAHPRSSLRLLPELAAILPTWLHRAAHQAEIADSAVYVQHTFDKAWIDLVRLSPEGARSFAEAVRRAAAQGPMGDEQ